MLLICNIDVTMYHALHPVGLVLFLAAFLKLFFPCGPLLSLIYTCAPHPH